MIKENYLGVEVCVASMDEVLEEIDGIILEGTPSFIVAINPEKIMKSQKDEKLRKMLNSARVQIADGVGIVLVSRLLGGKIRERVTGIDLMQNIIKKANEKGYRVYLLGAKPGIAEEASHVLKERYSNLEVVGTRDGYFENEDEVVEHIKSKSPDILFVAMGSPKQEYWITRNMDRLGVPLIMGVGGSYDVICGNVKRAPEWMCKIGLEWFHRLINEPWRYRRMTSLPKFLFEALRKR